MMSSPRPSKRPIRPGAALLDQACTDDPKRRRRIEVLLKAHELAEGFLEEPAPVPEPSDAITEGFRPESPPAPITAEGPGTRVGPYKLLQEIGQGGMGTVFLAEQDKPVRRKVALKVIDCGMDSATGRGPLRGRTPGIGPDGPSQYRQGVRRGAEPSTGVPSSSWSSSRESH